MMQIFKIKIIYLFIIFSLILIGFVAYYTVFDIKLTSHEKYVLFKDAEKSYEGLSHFYDIDLIRKTIRQLYQKEASDSVIMEWYRMNTINPVKKDNFDYKFYLSDGYRTYGPAKRVYSEKVLFRWFMFIVSTFIIIVVSIGFRRFYDKGQFIAIKNPFFYLSKLDNKSLLKLSILIISSLLAVVLILLIIFLYQKITYHPPRTW